MSKRKLDLPCGELIHIKDDLYKIRKKYRNGYLNIYYIKTNCCICKKTVYKDRSNYKRYKSAICSKECHKKRLSDVNNSKFKGRIQKSDGRVLVYVQNHPKSNNNYVYKHRLVMEKYLKRYLNPNELVHHIDFDKSNNELNNLYLVTRKNHPTIHSSVNKCIKILIKYGIVFFNKEIKEYEVSPKYNKEKVEEAYDARNG